MSGPTMAMIRIEALLPGTGSVPQNGCDPVSHAGFTAWKQNDEARFSLVVPSGYLSGKNLFIQLHESAPSPSMAHAWRVTTLLLRPGTHSSSEALAQETESAHYQSPATADRLSRRAFAVTGSTAPGRVAEADILPGDLISFLLKRIPAGENDDPEPIKVFDLGVDMTVNETRISNCPGRVGEVIDTVRDLFNETGGGILSDEFILRCLNRCLQDLAQDDYWRKQTWIASQADVYEIDLLSEIPDFQDIHHVYYGGSAQPMNPAGSFREFLDIKASGASGGTPLWYAAQNNSLFVWPPPRSSLALGFYVYYSYVPPELTCGLDNPNPPLPRSGDQALVYFALRQAFLRDRHAPGADLKYQEYSQLYEREKQRLLGEGDPPLLSLRPGR